MYPPQSPTRITNNSILKFAGAFHWVKTSSIRFWAFSYSIGEPCGRSDQVIIYFITLYYLSCADRWPRSRVRNTQPEVHQALENFWAGRFWIPVLTNRAREG